MTSALECRHSGSARCWPCCSLSECLTFLSKSKKDLSAKVSIKVRFSSSVVFFTLQMWLQKWQVCVECQLSTQFCSYLFIQVLQTSLILFCSMFTCLTGVLFREGEENDVFLLKYIFPTYTQCILHHIHSSQTHSAMLPTLYPLLFLLSQPTKSSLLILMGEATHRGPKDLPEAAPLQKWTFLPPGIISCQPLS